MKNFLPLLLFISVSSSFAFATPAFASGFFGFGFFGAKKTVISSSEQSANHNVSHKDLKDPRNYINQSGWSVGGNWHSAPSGNPITLETERTYIRPVTEEDLGDLMKIYDHPKVKEMTQEHFSVSDVRRLTNKPPLINPDYDFNLLNFAVISKQTGELIGNIQLGKTYLIEHQFGLSLKEISKGYKAVVGYTFSPKVWQQGIATEVLLKIKDYAFNQMGVTELLAETIEQNTASQRVLIKAGFHQYAESKPDGRGIKDHYFQVEAENGNSQADVRAYNGDSKTAGKSVSNTALVRNQMGAFSAE